MHVGIARIAAGLRDLLRLGLEYRETQESFITVRSLSDQPRRCVGGAPGVSVS